MEKINELKIDLKDLIYFLKNTETSEQKAADVRPIADNAVKLNSFAKTPKS